MPKKLRISDSPAPGTASLGGISPVRELTGHIAAVEPELRRLGWALAKYYSKTDAQRIKFMAIEALWLEYAKELKRDLALTKRSRSPLG